MWISITWADTHDVLRPIRNSHTYRREQPRPDFRIAQHPVLLPQVAVQITDSTPVTSLADHFISAWVAQVYISEPTQEERRHHREVQKAMETTAVVQARADAECRDARLALGEGRRSRGRNTTSTQASGNDDGRTVFARQCDWTASNGPDWTYTR